MNTRDVLVKARELISDPKHWNQRYFALKADGGFTSSSSPDAICWCASGAINKICGPDLMLVNSAYNALNEVMGNVPDYNDNSPHEDVLAAFDIAIALES